eukprot:TRINITY_DN11574_c0_g1_i1.p1 TRINITY_DN11574_c0_g1~~TRINITY_DN11574_c0_g1_i1.p1  ORF type:complete len:713 (+),score=168.71 TRINITY_DN11574_c0_g1_i1:41-2179(+)
MDEPRESIIATATAPELLDYDNTVRIPLLPQLNPPRVLPPEATHIGRLEYAAKYLEKLGIVPSERNIQSFLRKIPVEKKHVKAFYRSRGNVTDEMNVNPFLPDDKSRPFDIHVIRRESEAMKRQIQFAEMDVRRRTSAATHDQHELPSRQGRRGGLLMSAEAQPVLAFARRRDGDSKAKKKKTHGRRVNIAPTEIEQSEDHDVHDEAYDNLEHVRGLAAEESRIPQPPLSDAGQCQRVVNEFSAVFPFHLARVPMREEQILWLQEKLTAPEMGIASAALAQLAYWAAVGIKELPLIAEAKSRSLSLRIAHSFRTLVPNVSTQSVHGVAIPILLAALRATAHASLRISYLPAVIRLHGRDMFASIDDILAVLLDPARFYMQAALLKDQQVKRKLGGRVLATTSMPVQSLLGDAVSDAARRMLEGSPSLAHELHEPQRRAMAAFSRSVSPTHRSRSQQGMRPDSVAWSPQQIRPRSKSSRGTNLSSESGGCKSTSAGTAGAGGLGSAVPGTSSMTSSMTSVPTPGALAAMPLPARVAALMGAARASLSSFAPTEPSAAVLGTVLRPSMTSRSEDGIVQRVRLAVPDPEPSRLATTMSAPEDDMIQRTMSTKLTADQVAASHLKLSRRERHCLQTAMRAVLGLPDFQLSANYQHRIPQPLEENLTVEEAHIRVSTNLQQELTEQLMVDMQSLRDKSPSPPPRHPTSKNRRASFMV